MLIFVVCSRVWGGGGGVRMDGEEGEKVDEKWNLHYVLVQKFCGSVIFQTPRLGERTTLVVWGDPHFRVYKEGMMTCTAHGWRDYLNNDFITLRARNSFVSGSTAATIVTEVRYTLLYFNKTDLYLGQPMLPISLRYLSSEIIS